MNRSIALFVALAVLVAHAFALHSDASGDLAAPGERAYVAFRVARNLVHEGSWTWQYGAPGIDAYPSAAWVWACAAAARVYWPVNYFAATAGLTAALLTMIVASRFHRDRIASLIAPLLLAISGGFAAATVGGTEWPLFTLFVLTAFASMEKDRNRLLALALVLAGWTRPEGWIVAGGLFAMQLLRRRREHAGALWPFAVAVVGFAAITLVRLSQSGEWLAPALRELARIDPARWRGGAADLVSFLLVGAAPLLVVFALWYLARGRLTATGRRALELFALWCAIAVAAGGGSEAFHLWYLPALPLALIAAQEGMIEALNSPRRFVRGTAWSAFGAAVLLAALSSRGSRDIGPLAVSSWQESVDARLRGAEGRPLGRAGLDQERETTALLRAVGVYLRDETDPYASVGTPWPGSIAYLSRRDVWDLRGRATAPAPGVPRNAWTGQPRVDLPAALERRPDYLVPRAEPAGPAPTPQELAAEWVATLDAAPEDPARVEAVLRAFADYELITVPVRPFFGRTAANRREFFHLLRRRDLDLAPELRVEVADGELRVFVDHEGSEQLAHLRVLVENERGTVTAISPHGAFGEPHDVLARTNLLLFPTDEREVLAFHVRLPREDGTLRRVRATLLNPGARGAGVFDRVGEEAVLELR